MSWLTGALAVFGWRGALGAALAAAVLLPISYQTGRWVEAAVTKDAIARALAERTVKQMEAENARLRDAAEARRAAFDGTHADGDGRLPDDGFRRD